MKAIVLRRFHADFAGKNMLDGAAAVFHEIQW